MKRITYFFTVLLLSGCTSKQNKINKINLIYCPESNNETTFQIPKDIVSVFKSKNKNDTIYEIVSDSKIRLVTSNFPHLTEVPVFRSFTWYLFGSSNTNKTDELIMTELSGYRFNKKAKLKYPEEPTSRAQVFIHFNPKNQVEEINNNYFVNSVNQINDVLMKLADRKCAIYLFNSLKIHQIKKSTIIAKTNVGKNKIELEKQPLRADSIKIIKFDRDILSIDHTNSGNTLTWRSPSRTKNDEISYSITFTNNDNNLEFFKRNVSNQNSLSLSELSNIDFLRTRKLPKKGVKVTITATKKGYKNVTESKELALMYDRNEKIAIWNCYNN
jgi:hypothetical protein